MIAPAAFVRARPEDVCSRAEFVHARVEDHQRFGADTLTNYGREPFRSLA